MADGPVKVLRVFIEPDSYSQSEPLPEGGGIGGGNLEFATYSGMHVREQNIGPEVVRYIAVEVMKIPLINGSGAVVDLDEKAGFAAPADIARVLGVLRAHGLQVAIHAITVRVVVGI